MKILTQFPDISEQETKEADLQYAGNLGTIPFSW